VKDPDHYLTFREVPLSCPVFPKRKAQIIPAMRVQLNHEVFYFSGAQARSTFLKEPTRYCGLLTDPVSAERFQPTPKSPRLEWEGRTYFFQADSTRATFRKEPEKYADRSGA